MSFQTKQTKLKQLKALNESIKIEQNEKMSEMFPPSITVINNVKYAMQYNLDLPLPRKYDAEFEGRKTPKMSIDILLHKIIIDDKAKNHVAIAKVDYEEYIAECDEKKVEASKRKKKKYQKFQELYNILERSDKEQGIKCQLSLTMKQYNDIFIPYIFDKLTDSLYFTLHRTGKGRDTKYHIEVM